MSFCIECLNFIRRKGIVSPRCMRNNPMKLNSLDARCESFFRNCSDYTMDKGHYVSNDDNAIFIVTYHGLLEKIEIARVHSEEVASKMCSDANMKVESQWLGCGIGITTYKKKKE